MRVAIYARVSTDDRGQDPENQLRGLRAWVTNSGHKITREYVDYESGRKGADKRKQFATLFDDAAKRKFDCVLFWTPSRALESLSDFFGSASFLRGLGSQPADTVAIVLRFADIHNQS
jgi:DNA invertase Pin-like site-specific DNA recombinase